MLIQSKPFRSSAKKLTLAIVALLACASIAWAEASQELFEKVKSSVVQVNVGKGSLGSGCVVDAEKGIIATNYHVIEHAKGEQVNVVFPADKDNKSYPSDGFIEIQPTKDLALIHIDPTKRKLKALKLADSLPGQGEHAYAIGSPLGLPLTFTEGMVAAVRSGKELSEIMAKMAGPGYYEKGMGYDLDAEWIQHAVAISQGNSGGPLINAKGEVLGLNTWVYAPGTGNSLYFAISAIHLKKLLAGASTNVKGFASLPAPRNLEKRGPGGPGPGDPEKTLAVWKTFNKAMIEFNKKNAEADKRREAVPPVDPRNYMKGRTLRNRKLSAAFKLYATAYKGFAGTVKGLDSDRSVNTELVQWMVNEGVVLDRTGAAYQELATAVLTDSGMGDFEEAKVAAYKSVLENLRAQYDVHRINLSRIFNKNFPTVEETERDPGADSGKDDAKKEKKADGGSDDKAKSAADAEKRSELRTWTSKNGKFKVRAKLRGVEDGKAKLEKEDGAVLRVPLSALSEADQRFIGTAT